MLPEIVAAVLKSTVRAGWGLCGVKNVESVADHMYRMAILAFLTNSKTQLNKDKYVTGITQADQVKEALDIVPFEKIKGAILGTYLHFH